jgi:NTE family protein
MREEAGMAGRALVLGGGGITGIAWELGMLAGMAEHGVELHDADLVIGTSAGSVVGALIASGTGLDELYASQLAPPGPYRPLRMRMATMVRWGLAAVCSRRSEQLGVRLGKMALAAATVPEGERRRFLEARLGARTWPERDLLITAVDAESGQLAVFGRGSQVGGTAVTLLDAVTASCSVPGVWPPVAIGGRHWIDGGVRSTTNADLAAGYERIVVLAPIPWGVRGTGAAAQVAALRKPAHGNQAQGKQAQVALITPDAATRRATGHNMLDLARRAPVAAAGRRQANSVAAEVARVWSD